MPAQAGTEEANEKLTLLHFSGQWDTLQQEEPHVQKRTQV
jgi:hypothetical protein